MESMPKDLGDGLVLKAPEERHHDGICRLCGQIFGSSAGEDVARLLAGDWADGPADWLIVEDTRKNTVVSCACVLKLTWAYRGTPFSVGRPELVATDPQYRNRGLIRRQFETIDQIGAVRGHSMLAVTGIPLFYRQFGYEQAINLEGGRLLRIKPNSGATDLTIRPSHSGDLTFIEELSHLTSKDIVYSHVLSRRELEWDFEESQANRGVVRWSIIEISGRPIGYTRHAKPEAGSISVFGLRTDPQTKIDRPWPLLAALASYTRSDDASGSSKLAEVRLLLGRGSLFYDVPDDISVETDPLACLVDPGAGSGFLSRRDSTRAGGEPL